ncbi:histidine kinase [Streptomyces caelestis]|uniref:histidine kinase n=1 Tax=Streptomyces caelestis TaxID=36816 RepID=A0A0M8QP86_9ACTN|nr:MULTISPECIES: histidine kinase [Streptomyces]KOT42610.1 histidine kinase [Streptomyces caelestis]
MKRTDDRLPPLVLLGAQALVWPGADLVRGNLPAGVDLFVAALVAGLVTAALSLRRSKPVATLLLVAAACALGAAPLPTGATALLGTAGVALALFTVAGERDTFTALLCVTTLAAWQSLYNITLHGLSDRNGLDIVLTALLYAAACAAGMLVRRSRLVRRAAEQRLKRAELERHRLPAAERQRMERELHDVSAHHLTAVVVTAGAALGLRDRRPELADEALRFAAETGREVTRALGAVRAPAPSRDRQPSPRERLLDLVAGVSRLGQHVECEIDALPDGVVGDAVYGIVREALTNVARHAPGAFTTVTCRYGDARTEVVVTSAAPPAGSPAYGAGLGSGRGQGFLRSRAREAGGTLTSGPTAEGGWEVRAVLPGRVAAASVRQSVPWQYRLAQVTAAVGLVVQPMLPFLLVRADSTTTGPGVSAGVLFALLAAGQALALLWRRRAPRTAQGLVFGLAPLWPVAMAAGAYTGWVLLPPLLSMAATCAVIASAAARTAAAGPPLTGGRPGPSGWTGPVLAVLVHAAATTAALLHRGVSFPAWALAAGSTAQAALVVGAAWWGGTRRGRHRRAAHGARTEHLAAWTEEAVRDAWAERRRIAAGLETTVLTRTADMVALAEAGRLDEVVGRAREALAAMRALLDTVRDSEATPALRPQPTLQALDLLGRQLRATGRDVEIRLTARIPRRLPTAVDLAAYHACETVLAVGGEEPMVVELDADDSALTLTAIGVPDPVRSALCRRLSARAAVAGGTVTAGPAGPVLVLLPLTAAPSAQQDDEEGQR